VADIIALRSGHADVIRTVLGKSTPLPASLVPHVIPLLAVDAIAPDAIRALRRVAEERVGELVDALLDPNQPFAIRRRLPRVFAVCVSQRAADGLMLGLDDLRFEVRFQCGRALAAIIDKNPRIRIDHEFVLACVRREVAVSRTVWEGRQLLDGIGGPGDERSALEVMVGERATQSLAHVFTLLALLLPPEPLRVAFCALHTTDQALRGTALEYLDAVLPADVRERLWPFLEYEPASRRPTRPREDIVADLLRSNASIMLNLTR
jgi:ATP:ADP antiporter, AAA family